MTTTSITKRLAWHETPVHLRRLFIDAQIYKDADVAAIVEAARCGDPDALATCDMLARR